MKYICTECQFQFKGEITNDRKCPECGSENKSHIPAMFNADDADNIETFREDS